MKKVIVFFVIFCLAFFAYCESYAQDLSLFQSKIFLSSRGKIPYRILYPEGYDSTKSDKYPLLIFLHGRGECGTDNQKQLIHGSKLFLANKKSNQFPAIVVFPQCEEESYWSNVNIIPENTTQMYNFQKSGKPTLAMQKLMELLTSLLANQKVDLSRVYVGGLSMGGMGTYELLRRKPGVFAAAFAICGGDLPQNVKKYKKVPLWIFHGEKDDAVSVNFSRQIEEKMKEQGVEYKATYYPNDAHNSWDSAFAEPDFLSWIFSHKKK